MNDLQTHEVRVQKLHVVFRAGKYLTITGWHEDIARATVYPSEEQAQRKADLDVGMPCDLIPVLPRPLNPSPQTYAQGGDLDLSLCES